MAYLLYHLLAPLFPCRKREQPMWNADAQMEFDLALARARARTEIRRLQELYELPAYQPVRGWRS